MKRTTRRDGGTVAFSTGFGSPGVPSAVFQRSKGRSAMMRSYPTLNPFDPRSDRTGRPKTRNDSYLIPLYLSDRYRGDGPIKAGRKTFLLSPRIPPQPIPFGRLHNREGGCRERAPNCRQLTAVDAEKAGGTPAADRKGRPEREGPRSYLGRREVGRGLATHQMREVGGVAPAISPVVSPTPGESGGRQLLTRRVGPFAET